MASFRDLLAQAKSAITEVDTADAASRIERGVVVLDVREPDEYEQGALPNALHIPRGHLEAQIETKIVDKSAPVVVYCAGGVRSAFAAKTLAELGYTDVVSMAGGFGKWKDEGRAWRTPATLNAEQKIRYQRHLLLPEVGIEGQAKLLASKVLMLGAGGLGSPAALYLAAAGVDPAGFGWASVQLDGGIERVLGRIDAWFDERLATLAPATPVTAGPGALRLALQSAGPADPATAQALAAVAATVLAAVRAVLWAAAASGGDDVSRYDVMSFLSCSHVDV